LARQHSYTRSVEIISAHANVLCILIDALGITPSPDTLMGLAISAQGLRLVTNVPTKLVSSHSEFSCKSYLVFGLSSSAPGPARLGSRPDLPAADRTSPALERTAILARVSAPGWKILVGHRTVRSPIRWRRTYGQTVRRATFNGYIFPTYKYPFFLLELTTFLGFYLLDC
jgi:hypothetical protein